MENNSQFTAFETEIAIRPDDIDLNNHVHSSKYLDYVLAARFVQMKENYKMSMNEFHNKGLNWFASTYHIEFKRALTLTDKISVRTQILEVNGAQAKVGFWIINKLTNKTAAEGYFIYTMVSLSTGRPIRITEEVINKYSI